MENGRGYNYDIVDSYFGLEALNSMVKSGTEEIGFFSETGTYNRDNVLCGDFAITSELIEKIDALVEKMQNALAVSGVN